MTDDKQQRADEFKRVFESIPGRKIDRIRKVCEILHCEENTVRLYLLQTPNRRVMPRAKLRILADALAAQA